MRIVLQRVKSASVSISGRTKASAGPGFLILLGIETEDTEEDADWLSSKICSLRVFGDEEGKMNMDIKQTGGDILIVSQFTLHAAVKKGNRPSFIKSARPETAIPLYNYFIRKTEALLEKPCFTGEFGADMQVELINDGPVTILLDSKNKE